MASAALEGARVRLRPLEPIDYAGLRRQELTAQLAFRWRHHGAHEPPEFFPNSLWAHALVHFIVEDKIQNVSIGIVSAYGADFQTGTIYIAAAKFDSKLEVGSRIVGSIGLLIDYLFQGWPLRKIYFETPEYNLQQFEGAVGWLLVEEARFREHVFLNGRYWDQVVLTLWRDNWIQNRKHVVRWA